MRAIATPPIPVARRRSSRRARSGRAAADRRSWSAPPPGVLEHLRGSLDRFDDGALARRLGLLRTAAGQAQGCGGRPSKRAEILRREVASGTLAQVLVDLLGADRMPPPPVMPGEQPRTTIPALERADERGELPIVKLRLPGMPALRREPQPNDGVLVHDGVGAQQGRQPEAAVLVGIRAEPTRRAAESSIRNAPASTRSRPRCSAPRSRVTPRRAAGRASAKASILSNLTRSFCSRQSG